jgi:predicted deacylase
MSPIIDSISTRPQAPRLGKAKILQIIDTLEPEQFPPNKLEHRFSIVTANTLGPVNLPVLAYRGSDGPTIGITSAIHGNEVNGIAVIQRLFARLETIGSVIPAIIIGVPILNAPGFLDSVRSFDGQDLNRLMPGYVP